MGHKWKPFQRTTFSGSRNPKVIQAAMERYGFSSPDEAEAELNRWERQCEYYVNDLYQVELRRFDINSDKPDLPSIPMVSLNIRRRDGAPIHDWRHMQQIKNELVSPDCEAVEIYPAVSRLVDTSNKYHLWVFADPNFRLPFGFTYSDVQYEENKNVPGLRQRPKTWDYPDTTIYPDTIKSPSK